MVVFLEEDVGMSVRASVNEMESSEVADVINDVTDEMGSENAKAGGVIQAQDRECGPFQKLNFAVKCGEMLFCPPKKRIRIV